MSKLADFTLNSEFPAISKMPSVSLAFEMPAKRYAGGASETKTFNITIPSVGIVQPSVTVYQLTSLNGTYIVMGQIFNIKVQVDRTSATNMRVTWSLKNNSTVEQPFSGNTYRVDIALFNVP